MLSKDEHNKRMEIYRQGGSLVEMAAKAHLSSTGFRNWMAKNNLTHTRVSTGRNKISQDEVDRRMAAINEGGTIREVAAKLQLGKNNLGSWMWANGIKPVKKPKSLKPKLIVNRNPEPYVQDRPKWERDRMRHFGSTLLRVTEHGKGFDVMKFIDTYRKIYGDMSQEERHERNQTRSREAQIRSAAH